MSDNACVVPFTQQKRNANSMMDKGILFGFVWSAMMGYMIDRWIQWRLKHNSNRVLTNGSVDWIDVGVGDVILKMLYGDV